MDFVKVLSLLSFLSLVAGHARWTCPTPRTANPGNKVGPCGPIIPGGPDIFNGSQATIAPGPMTLVWEETIVHAGAPYRIALSMPGVDVYDNCILLDHIPHADITDNPNCSRDTPCFVSQMHSITVEIPDVACEFCSLQIISVMTDKTPLGEICVYDNTRSNVPPTPGLCHSNYHSCANVRITGSVPRDQFVCKKPTDWPYARFPHYAYSQEAGPWTNGRLAGLPPRYNTPAGPCAKEI